jgi:hypothetical protein
MDQIWGTKRYRRNSIASLTLEDGSIVSEHKDKEKNHL